ncbi:MAG: TIGR02147 family protein [Bdellovibrionota bacterium]
MTTYHLEPANFSDYRDFLKHRFENLKKENKKFSLNACAKRSKISKSLFQFILNKKRHLGLDRMPPLAKALHLSADEEYFTYLMICKSSSRNPIIQSHFEKILNRIRHEYVKSAVDAPMPSTTNDKELYLNYFFMILQTFTKLKDFRENAQWIKDNLMIPNLNEIKITSTLKELENLGFIFRDDQNNLKSRPESLWRPDPYDPTGHRVYTKAAEGIAELMQKPDLYRPSVYMSMSLALDEENLLKAEKFMIDVHHQLLKFSVDSRQPTAVAQICNFLLTVVRLKNH